MRRFSPILPVMPTPGTDNAPHARGNAACAAAFAAGLTCALAQALWFLNDPLGAWPVLDARENLQLAGMIAGGHAGIDTFYRAPGYAALLSLPLLAGAPAGALPLFAALLGAFLHAGTAALVARLAQRLAGIPAAGWPAGLLYALHPVAVWFAPQPLDTTAGIFLLCASLAALPRPAPRPPPGAPCPPLPALRWAAAGLLLGAAVVFRPQHLAVAPLLALPLLWERGALRRMAALAAAAGGFALPLLVLGCTALAATGGFRILPWQGAYNLWAANRPGADGRCYRQQAILFAPPSQEHRNPAQVEAEILYNRETGGDPSDIGAQNAHWRGRLLSHIRSAPLDWAGLLARKAWYLVHNAEQYNNLTYAFHKARSPWLRWNPLCWAVLAAAGAAGLVLLPAGGRATAALPLLVAGAGICASVLLTYASDRFRLPLAPLAAAAAGGLVLAPAAPLRTRLAAAAAALLVVCPSLTNLANAGDRSSEVQDCLLLSIASQRSGDDGLALQWAREALARAPGRPDAAELALASAFNLALAGSPRTPALAEWRGWLESAPADLPDVRLARAFADWHAGATGGALAAWRGLAAAPSDAAPLAAALAAAAAGDPRPSRLSPEEWAALRRALAPSSIPR